MGAISAQRSSKDNVVTLAYFIQNGLGFLTIATIASMQLLVAGGGSLLLLYLQLQPESFHDPNYRTESLLSCMHKINQPLLFFSFSFSSLFSLFFSSFSVTALASHIASISICPFVDHIQ